MKSRARIVVPVLDAASRARLERLAPVVRNKVARDGATTAYVCRAGVCRLPTTDPATFRRQLDAPFEPGGPDQMPPRSPRKKQHETTPGD